MTYHSNEARLEGRIKVDANGCHNWTGFIDPKGYGMVWDGRTMTRTHRFAYIIAKGAIPNGLQLDHLCRNRRCCNPAHLEPVTARENIFRGEGIAVKRARATHCQRGHPFDEQNTRWIKGRYRWCRECGRAAARKAYARRKAP